MPINYDDHLSIRMPGRPTVERPLFGDLFTFKNGPLKAPVFDKQVSNASLLLHVPEKDPNYNAKTITYTVHICPTLDLPLDPLSLLNKLLKPKRCVGPMHCKMDPRGTRVGDPRRTCAVQLGLSSVPTRFPRVPQTMITEKNQIILAF